MQEPFDESNEDDVVTATPPARGTSWQFSIRDLLYFTTVVAIHFAALAALVRGSQESMARVMLLFIGMQAIVIPASCGVHAVFHRRRSGRRDFRLQWRRKSWRGILLSISFPLLCILFANVIPTGVGYDSIRIGLMGGLTGSLVYAVCESTFRSIDLCSNGILINQLAFIPWHRLKPNTIGLNADGELEIARWWTTAVATVPPEQREAVGALLREELPTTPYEK